MSCDWQNDRWCNGILGHEDNKLLATFACNTEGSKQHVNESIDLHSDQDLTVFLMQLLLKALHICLVCLVPCCYLNILLI